MGGVEAAGEKWFVEVVLSAFVLAFVGFAIYFIFKHIQLVLQAINLYKAMVNRLDKIITLMEKNVRMTTDISSKVTSISSIMTPPPVPEATKQAVLPLPVPVHKGDPSSVLLKVSEVQGFLAKLGYKVDLDGKHWAIKYPEGESALYAYSEESLKNHAEVIASKHKITITWAD
jgi:hypothetical protein